MGKLNIQLTDKKRLERNRKAREKYIKNKQKILKKRKELYYEKHQEKKIKYYAKNKKIINKKHSEYHKKQYHENIQFRIKNDIKTIINLLLKNNWKNKNLTYILSCNPEFFKEYIENRFKPGMSWDNKKEWHIDHIIPVSKFDLTILAELKQCYHYTNFQPLWADENRKKAKK